MHALADIPILPYPRIVGQEKLKLALELAYIAPHIGGVLISGHRGTAKSTAVRAFSRMMYGRLPVTLPINATEDRVVGGWDIDELMRGEPKRQPGLLEEANGELLYIDEVNLLDDHIVNIILDVTSTNLLVLQREGQSEQLAVSFTLVGTMNPEEGWLRPQLRDRFGLMASVVSETDRQRREEILWTVLNFDEAVFGSKNDRPGSFIDSSHEEEEQLRSRLLEAKSRLYEVDVPPPAVGACVRLAEEFKAEGHRGDFLIALAARAAAAREGVPRVGRRHVRAVSPLALQHRRPEAAQSQRILWGPADDQRMEKVLGDLDD